MSWENNDINVLTYITKLSRITCISFFKLTFWKNNKISTNSLEDKNNFIKIKIKINN